MSKVAGFLASTAIGCILTAAGVIVDAYWLLITGLVLLAISLILLLADWTWKMIKGTKIIGCTHRAPPGSKGTFFTAQGDVEGIDLVGNASDAANFADFKGKVKDARIADNAHTGGSTPESQDMPQEQASPRKYFSGWRPPGKGENS